MKRAREEQNEAVAEFGDLSDEVKQVILVSIHHKESHLNTVCKSWKGLLDGYTGWFDIARHNYHRFMYGKEHERALSGTIRTIFETLQTSRSHRIERFCNYIGHEMNSKLKDLYYASPNLPTPIIESLAKYVKEHTPNVLTLENFHKRDIFLNFTEIGHRYGLVLPSKRTGKAKLFESVKPDDNEKPSEPVPPEMVYNFLSVTTFIHTLFPHFDSQAVIAKMMANTKKWNDPIENAYYGMTAEEILAQWEEISTLASTEGTAMHANLEYYYSERPYVTNTKEFALFKEYEKVHVTGKLKPYRTEWTIWCELLQLCGSVDILYEYVNEVDHGDGKKHLVMRDWKRSKKIEMFNTFQSGSVPCTENMGDCNYCHYTLQLSLYKYILEKYYNVVIDSLDLVVLHPNQAKFICMPVRYDLFKETFEKVIQYRLDTIAACA